MQKLLFIKLGLILSLILLLMIPLSLIEGVVGERVSYRAEARADIERSWTGSQHLVGPVLVAPYELRHVQQVWDAAASVYHERVTTTRHKLVLLPEQLDVVGSARIEERRRGLYSVPVYTSSLAISGSFDFQGQRELEREYGDDLSWSEPYVSLMVSDLRGVISQPSLQWDGTQRQFESGSLLDNAGPGMHLRLGDRQGSRESPLAFSMDLMLRGMEALNFAPVGRNTRVQLQSPWPHPSFVGRYLPSSHTIDPSGFTAEWHASAFSSGMEEMARACGGGECSGLVGNTFGVALVNSVDVYQQSERALKYGVLFILLTFALFFVYEVLQSLALHPVQYLLVGLALAFFFLLLVSLSEHLAFGLAYLLAALACALLLTFYVAGILRDRRAGAVFGATMLLLYGVLYVILQSEDNALLMGSVLLFGALTGAMVTTRHVDWYRLRGATAPTTEAAG